MTTPVSKHFVHVKTEEQLKTQTQPRNLKEMMESKSQARGYRKQYFYVHKNAHHQHLTKLSRQERTELMARELLNVCKYFMATGPISFNYVMGELGHFMRVYVIGWSNSLTAAAHWLGLKRTTFVEQLKASGVTTQVRRHLAGKDLEAWKQRRNQQMLQGNVKDEVSQESHLDGQMQEALSHQLCESHTAHTLQDYRLLPEPSTSTD